MESSFSVEMGNEADLNRPVENCIICIIFNSDNCVFRLPESKYL